MYIKQKAIFLHGEYYIKQPYVCQTTKALRVSNCIILTSPLHVFTKSREAFTVYTQIINSCVIN